MSALVPANHSPDNPEPTNGSVNSRAPPRAFVGHWPSCRFLRWGICLKTSAWGMGHLSILLEVVNTLPFSFT